MRHPREDQEKHILFYYYYFYIHQFAPALGPTCALELARRTRNAFNVRMLLNVGEWFFFETHCAHSWRGVSSHVGLVTWFPIIFSLSDLKTDKAMNIWT